MSVEQAAVSAFTRGLEGRGEGSSYVLPLCRVIYVVNDLEHIPSTRRIKVRKYIPVS